MAKLSEKHRKMVEQLKKNKKKKAATRGRKTTTKGVKTSDARKKVAKVVAKTLKEGKVPKMSEIKKDAGYSDSYSEKTVRLERSQTFKELLAKEIPDQERAMMIKGIGEAKKTWREDVPMDLADNTIEAWITGMGGVLHKITENKKFKVKTVLFWIPDNLARAKAADILAKIMGDYAPQKVEDVTNPYARLTDAELDEEIKKREK